MPGDEGAHRLRFGEQLTIQALDDILSQLRDALAGGDAVDVDCSGAAEVDVSIIQLLLAARVSARASNKTLRVFTGDGVMFAALEAGGFLTPEDGAGREPFWIAERR